MTYSIKQQDGEWIVVNSNGIIISYCNTRSEAEDVAKAQTNDDERSHVMEVFNFEQTIKSLRSQYSAEFI